MPADALDEQDRLAFVVASDRGRGIADRRAAHADAGQVQRQGVEALFEDLQIDGAGQPDATVFDRAIVFGGQQQSALRRGDFGRLLLGLGEQIVVFLTRQEHALRVALHQRAEVFVRNEDLADLFGLGGLGRGRGGGEEGEK